MKTQVFYSILAVCLSAAPATLGQSAIPDVFNPTVQTQPLRRGGSNGRRVLPTPARMAQMQRASQLACAAASSLHAGNYAQAEAEARQSISIDSLNSGVSEEVLAAALERQDKDQEALQQYQTVVEHYDRQPRNLLPYAQLLLKSGQWTEALALYNQVLPRLPDIGMHPETPVVHDSALMKANSRFSVDAPEPAALATAIHIARGMVYNTTPSWAGEAQDTEAMGEYGKALQLAPNNALTNYYYGAGWQKLSPTERVKFGTVQQAKAHLQKAVKTGNANVKAAAQKALKELG